MKDVLAYPSYDDLHIGCGTIVQKLLAFDKVIPNRIVALSRGGLFPGLVISHMLEAIGYPNKVMPVAYSSKSGYGDGKNHDNILPLVSHEKILIVDDIADGGHTMEEVTKAYTSLPGNQVVSAVLYWKESSIFTPDLFWQKIPADAPWIIFPFEK